MAKTATDANKVETPAQGEVSAESSATPPETPPDAPSAPATLRVVLNPKVRQDEHVGPTGAKVTLKRGEDPVEVTGEQFDALKEHQTWQDGKFVQTVVEAPAE